MIDGVIIKKIAKNTDSRGWLAEIYRQDEQDYKPAMSYVSLTKPGVIRGPHEHKQQSDCFVFIGPGDFALHLWDRRKHSATNGKHLSIKVGEKKPTLVIVPPGIVHGYKCVGQAGGWCINLPNQLYRGKGKRGKIDEIRWEIDPASPYKIE
ncbi:MAG: dTDP-4-dehydrorhamnose 3,5-epimerase family protein [Patescibacteria group bacterium]|nr:dTDP-4-dehydrorhamnose 3,5-epimerase family protein [Patescibacteria group bacterium]